MDRMKQKRLPRVVLAWHKSSDEASVRHIDKMIEREREKKKMVRGFQALICRVRKAVHRKELMIRNGNCRSLAITQASKPDVSADSYCADCAYITIRGRVGD